MTGSMQSDADMELYSTIGQVGAMQKHLDGKCDMDGEYPGWHRSCHAMLHAVFMLWPGSQGMLPLCTGAVLV